MELKSTRARDLDKFIENHLLPDTQFRRQVKQAIDVISSFLKERCFQDSLERVRVCKVVKGGSSGKGTALRGRSDADLVVFLINLTSFEEQFNRRAEFIQEIRRQLEACQRERRFEVMFTINTFENPRALSFRLTQRSSLMNFGEFVEFDILPAYDALGQWTKNQIPSHLIYIKLITECENLGKEGEFSSCFTELQRAFLKERPTKLKSLIRLVKCWFQECRKDLGKPLPQQYALELLTVYAWEEGCDEPYFNTAQGFRTVLELVLKYKQLCIFWEKYYDFTHPFIGRYLKSQLNKPRSSGPYGQCGSGNEYGWQRLAQAARTWLNYPCFKNWDGSPVESWHVSPAKTIRNECKYSYYIQPEFQCSREYPREYAQEDPMFFQSFRKVERRRPSPPPVEEEWSCSIL